MKYTIKHSRKVKLKTGSTISTHRTQFDTIWVKAQPFKRKNHQPKSGFLHLSEDAALVLATQLILELDIANSEILDKIEFKLKDKI